MTAARLRHPRARLLGTLLAGTLGVGMLAGCAPEERTPPPRPEPIPTPLYSSDEKALAAARDAYARYVQVANEVGHDGWGDLAPLDAVTTGSALKGDRKTGRENRAKGLRVDGELAGRVASLQRVDESSVTVYTCLDVSGTRLIDAGGVDRTSPNRGTIYPFEVTLVPAGDNLKVSRSSVWSDDSFC